MFTNTQMRSVSRMFMNIGTLKKTMFMLIGRIHITGMNINRCTGSLGRGVRGPRKEPDKARCGERRG